MKTGPRASFLRRFYALLLPFLPAAVFLLATVSGAAEWRIENPYAGVDWGRYHRFKANFHTHTTMSDGRSTPQEVIDEYARLGYAVLALTDHDTVGPGNDPAHPERRKTTWPWQAFGRDPEAAGMVAIEGNEISKVHHIGSYFNDYGDPEVDTEDSALREIGSRGGLAVLFHPGRYRRTVEWYRGMFQSHPHLIGLEVYNQGDKYPNDRRTWDAVQTGLAAGRLVWGFANDDLHDPKTQLGRNWNLMLLPELSADWVRRGLEAGMFFFVHAPDGHNGAAPPVVRSISVDSGKGVIDFEVTGHEVIEWISEGEIVHRGDRVILSGLSGLGGYIRAVIRASGSGPLVGTQPFRISPPAEPSERMEDRERESQG